MAEFYLFFVVVVVVKPPNIRENRIKMEHLSQFFHKSDKKVAPEINYRRTRKLEFYSTDRKKKNVIRLFLFQ